MPTIGLPFYYDEINKLRGHKVPSVGLCYDSETFFFFWRSLYQRLASKFKWSVPDHWDKEVFEFTLYSLGFVGVFDTNKYATTPNQRYGIIPAPSTVHGIGVQMQPTKIRTANPHFYMPYSETIYDGAGLIRLTSDYMGMLATAMNGLALQDALEARGINSRVQTSIEMREIAEPFIQRKAEKHLNRGRVVIFACGTGHPYFTTDTAAVLRATEIKADIILLGKAIDAVYSADPKIQPDAIRFEEISYLDVLNKDLKVMDSTATAMCRDNNIPLLVFGIADPENIVRAVKGEKIGTLVK